MYQQITLKEMEDLLKSEKGWKKYTPYGEEAYFDFTTKNFIVRVWTSIIDKDVSRACGKDAIRVSLLTQKDETFVGVKKFSIVRRELNWRKHLKTRVMEAIDYIKNVKICQKCGFSMSLRKAKQTGNEFYGCTKYPFCRYTENV